LPASSCRHPTSAAKSPATLAPMTAFSAREKFSKIPRAPSWVF